MPAVRAEQRLTPRGVAGGLVGGSNSLPDTLPKRAEGGADIRTARGWIWALATDDEPPPFGLGAGDVEGLVAILLRLYRE